MFIKTIQMEVIPGRPDLNYSNMCEQIAIAKSENVNIIVFPELCISGYLIGDTYEEMSFINDVLYYNECIKKLNTDDFTIVFGSIHVDKNFKNQDGRVLKTNACFVGIDNIVIKTLLPNYREFDEKRHFTNSIEYYSLLNKKYCFNPITIKDKKIGFTICEDGWDDNYNISPTKELINNGAELIINISCSPFTINKNVSRDRVFSKHAKNTPLLYVNAIGVQNIVKTIYSFDGSTVAYDKTGKKIYQAQMFKEESNIFELNNNKELICNSNINNEKTEIETIYDSLIYSIRSYMKMSNLKNVVIGSSGGIDSAVVSTLFVDAIGNDNVYLVNMPSKNNSETTKQLSKQLADNLNVNYITIPIQDSYDLTIKQVDGIEFSKGKKCILSNLAKENIQARDRSSRILASIASGIESCVFTCNGNKTELTVGYATYAGDMLGFIAPLGDLWKTQVYDLARYLNKDKERIPNEIFNIVPSAELSPDQNIDEGKGDPIIYWYHDKLFKLFVESWNRYTPEDILLAYYNSELEDILGLTKNSLSTIFKSNKEFISDLERWYNLFKGLSVMKRGTGSFILAVSRRAYGFDYRETLNSLYYSIGYIKLKNKLLNE